MSLETWEAELPAALRAQAIWKVQAYRLAAHAAYCAAGDCAMLATVATSREVSEQLLRAVGSISANIAEGYARRSRADRVRYYEYALGSAGEAQSWYLSARAALSPATADERLDALNRVTRLLLVMIRNERDGLTWNATRTKKGEA